ncbi:transmembrane protein [Anaeramoeba flamelloides]|uniref:Transmembrane protein n=1 Tax=Anaeramoeba flamelloides TaxID=1746091 RepID=A0ABQ8Y3C8_9EUKA|nr:transmembrane protein [Anaeramoeba flamelloides]
MKNQTQPTTFSKTPKKSEQEHVELNKVSLNKLQKNKRKQKKDLTTIPLDTIPTDSESVLSGIRKLEEINKKTLSDFDVEIKKHQKKNKHKHQWKRENLEVSNTPMNSANYNTPNNSANDNANGNGNDHTQDVENRNNDQMQDNDLGYQPKNHINFHLLSLFFTVAFFYFFISSIWCFANQKTFNHHPKQLCKNSVIWSYLVILALIYIANVIEFLKSSTLKYLKNISNETLAEYSKKIQQNQIMINWKGKAFHYENKTSFVHNDDTNVNYRDYKQTIKKKVVTYRNKRSLIYDRCRNVLEFSLFPQNYKILRLRCQQELKFETELDQEDYDQLKKDFSLELLRHDKKEKIKETFHIDGLQPYLLFYSDPKKRPLIFNPFLFYTLSFLALGWFFRLLVEIKCTKVDLKIIKVIKFHR